MSEGQSGTEATEGGPAPAEDESQSDGPQSPALENGEDGHGPAHQSGPEIPRHGAPNEELSGHSTPQTEVADNLSGGQAQIASVDAGAVPPPSNERPGTGMSISTDLGTQEDHTIVTEGKDSDTNGPEPVGELRVDEEVLLLQTPPGSGETQLITSLQDMKEMCELGTSRFGATRKFQRATPGGGSEFFAVKFYNAGDNCEGRQAFDDRMKQFLALSHPHVMPIAGVIAPTKGSGPIILTRFSPNGSLETVLKAVREGHPPRYWNDAAKLRLIVGLVSGLIYLHNHGIVHRELKPSDIIVDSDGSVLISDYATSIFEEHKYARASQVGGPSYMAPEVYDDQENQTKIRDSKTDVFSFSLILYEILSGEKVFPLRMSAATIMRRALSPKAKDRPIIPNNLHPIFQEMISRGWTPTLSKRPTMSALWQRMADVRFELFPSVVVTFIPLNA
jgi:hypothetical protein